MARARTATLPLARLQPPELSLKQEQEIDRLFTYHSPDELQQSALLEIRESAKSLAYTICMFVPEGPDRSSAIRKLRETVMTANAGIVLKGVF